MEWESENLSGKDLTLSLRNVKVTPGTDTTSYLATLDTSRGCIETILHPVEGGTSAVICVSGANGGLDGPVDGLYTRLPTLLRKSETSVLRLDYRKPNDFSECIIDVLAGCSFLKGIGASSIVLLGHSFGGGVVITAAQLHKLVCGVVSLSPQRFGTETVSELNMPLLLIHGTTDRVLPSEASEDIYKRAKDPKQLTLYKETGHSLVEARSQIEKLLPKWVIDRLSEKNLISNRTIHSITTSKNDSNK